jgi:NADPH-dependent curcumin reductase CurA
VQLASASAGDHGLNAVGCSLRCRFLNLTIGVHLSVAKAWCIASRPKDCPQLADFIAIEIPRRDLREGEVRVLNHWMSVDPYMRGRMNAGDSYITPFELDKPMDGFAVGEVIESRATDFQPGDQVLHMLGWRTEAVAPANQYVKLPSSTIPIQAYLGIMGMPGATAYFGLFEVAQAKAGECIFVSAAAGGVGSTVLQLAKNKGLTVVASVGGPEKVRIVRDLGADFVIDYKSSPSIESALRDAVPSGVDIYFDNVGHSHLDAALGCAKDFARFAICGMIQSYNSTQPTILSNAIKIIEKRIAIKGFVITDFVCKLDAFRTDMAALIQQGRIRSLETIRSGFESGPSAFLELFSGGNVGKMLVRLVD